MAHAIFNVSPVKFLSSIQDHVFTVTPTFKNKTYTKSDNKKKSPQPEEQRNSSASPVTLQLTLPTDTIEEQQQQMTEIQQQYHTPSYEQQQQSLSPSYEQQQQQSLSPSVLPIDIPRSYPLNVPINRHSHRGDEGLAMPNNFLSTSYNSHHSYSYQQQENNFVSLANSLSKSRYLPAEDLTLCFDGLAVRSPTGSFYSNGGIQSPQNIHSPINIGSPHNGFTHGFASPQNGFVSPQNGFVSPQNGFVSPQNGFVSPQNGFISPQNGFISPQNGFASPYNNNNYGSPHSPVYFDGGCSPQSTSFDNHQFFVGSPAYNTTNSFVGSPSFNNNNNSFVGSPSFNAVGSPNFNNNNNSSFVGSPNSPSCFLGSPALSPVYNNNELAIDTTNLTPRQQDEISSSYGFTYLSPSLTPQHQHQQQQTSPINSPTDHLYLIPPSVSGHYSRPSSPVPDDVILTASEINDYYTSTPSPSLVVDFRETTESPLTTGAMELFPTTSVVSPSSPHTQPQREILAYKEETEEEQEDEEEFNVTNKKKLHTVTPSGRRAKIHKCPYCNHTSNRANNMREHTQIHNPNRPKPHACKLCNRAFARKHDMNRHYISCKKQHSKINGGSARYAMSSPLLS